MIIMRRALLLIAFLAGYLGSNADAREALDRNTRFDSVDGFVTALKQFEPARTNNWLAYQFSAIEPGQSEDDTTGGVTLPIKIQSCSSIWQNDDTALVFAIANPPTVATHSMVGVLFFLDRSGKKWRIQDSKSFHALGKDVSIDCRMTSGDEEPLSPSEVIVTVTKHESGRHQWFETSFSFQLLGGIVPVVSE
jgi:hypothetical protein